MSHNGSCAQLGVENKAYFRNHHPDSVCHFINTSSRSRSVIFPRKFLLVPPQLMWNEAINVKTVCLGILSKSSRCDFMWNRICCRRDDVDDTGVYNLKTLRKKLTGKSCFHINWWSGFLNHQHSNHQQFYGKFVYCLISMDPVEPSIFHVGIPTDWRLWNFKWPKFLPCLP